MTAPNERRTVGELMTENPVTANVDMSLTAVAESMDFYRIDGLPVLDEEGSLVGVISQTDLLHARTTDAVWRAWPGLTVRHLMTRPAVTVSAGASIEEAAVLMEECGIHRLVVTRDENEATPIGVVSVSDLVRAIAVASERP